MRWLVLWWVAIAGVAHAQPGVEPASDDCAVPALSCVEAQVDGRAVVVCVAPPAIVNVTLFTRPLQTNPLLANAQWRGAMMQMVSACRYVGTLDAGLAPVEYYLGAHANDGRPVAQSRPLRFTGTGATQLERYVPPPVVRHDAPAPPPAAMPSDDGGDKPPVRPWRVALEVLAGAAGGAAAGTLTYYVVQAACDSCSDQYASDPPVIAGLAVGAAATGVGVWLAGRSHAESASLPLTLAGAGLGAALVFAVIDPNKPQYELFAIPVATAVIGFQLTRYRIVPDVSVHGDRTMVGLVGTF